MRVPVVASQMFTVLSMEDEMSLFPVGDQSTSVRPAVCPSRVWTMTSFATSQMATLKSSLPERSSYATASQVPLGDQSRAFTLP